MRGRLALSFQYVLHRLHTKRAEPYGHFFWLTEPPCLVYFDWHWRSCNNCISWISFGLSSYAISPCTSTTKWWPSTEIKTRNTAFAEGPAALYLSERCTAECPTGISLTDFFSYMSSFFSLTSHCFLSPLYIEINHNLNKETLTRTRLCVLLWPASIRQRAVSIKPLSVDGNSLHKRFLSQETYHWSYPFSSIFLGSDARLRLNTPFWKLGDIRATVGSHILFVSVFGAFPWLERFLGRNEW